MSREPLYCSQLYRSNIIEIQHSFKTLELFPPNMPSADEIPIVFHKLQTSFDH